MEKNNNTTIILEGYDENNINSVLGKLREVLNLSRDLGKLEDELKTKVKIYLKERNWDKYKDDTNNISVSFTKFKREEIDKDLLKTMIGENEYAQVLKTKTFERMDVITPETRKGLKKYV
jgi:hypothetical protein